MSDLFDLNNIKVDIDKIENEFTRKKNISLCILRLDKIHTEISGNKLFKLNYFIKTAIDTHKKIVTFGGAYSNHLAATASICNLLKINCIGIVNGKVPVTPSHTLQFCKKKGMHLHFLSREDYRKRNDNDFKEDLRTRFGDFVSIPEGGYSNIGANGAALISHFYAHGNFSHICCPVGTATTFAGLIKSAPPSQKVIGFTVLKNIPDIESRIWFLLDNAVSANYSLITNYHFDGFAKKRNELFVFMNKFYNEFSIPTDFIYTAKMMYGVFDLINKKYFPEGSNIICIHTGGLQGNFSLPTDSLNF